MWSNSWVNRCWPFKGSSRVKGKLSCTVPRGVGHRNVARLLDFPANKIEERLNELENNKKILIAVKKKLKERKNILPNILTQLISDATPPDIKGLHTLYYNAPSNIWPMAGTVNSGKGAKDSFSEAIYVMLNSILRLYGSEHFKDIFLKNLEKCQRFSGFTINPDLSSEQLIAQITQWATDQLSNGLDEEKTILPRYLDSQTMLEKFLDSDLVTLIEGYRGQQQKIMGSAARNVTYINPENVSLSELLVFRKISRGLVKRFSGQQSSSGSSSSASDPQDDSRISSQPLDQEQLPIAFQMLGMVFESLKEDTSDEKEFITKAMSALANSIKDQKLKGTIEAAATTIQKVKVAKRKREEEDRAGLLTGYDMMSPKKFGNKSDDKHLPQENVPKVIEDSGTKRPDSAPRKRR